MTEPKQPNALELLAAAKAAAAPQKSEEPAPAKPTEPEWTPTPGIKLTVGDFIRVTNFVFQVTAVPTIHTTGTARLHQGKCSQKSISVYADRNYPTLPAKHKLPFSAVSVGIFRGQGTTGSAIDKSPETLAGITPHG